jgi:hypothetical protein
VHLFILHSSALVRQLGRPEVSGGRPPGSSKVEHSSGESKLD